jgi:hypothetical protein
MSRFLFRNVEAKGLAAPNSAQSRTAPRKRSLRVEEILAILGERWALAVRVRERFPHDPNGTRERVESAKMKSRSRDQPEPTPLPAIRWPAVVEQGIHSICVASYRIYRRTLANHAGKTTRIRVVACGILVDNGGWARLANAVTT